MQRNIVVTAADGLHARPAAQLAQLARQLPGTLHLLIGGRVVNAASVLAVMDLELSPGTPVTLEADGPAAEAALDAATAILAPPH
ncbi:HPr family phosphocarrier protein [Microbacterium sp. NPDC003461]